MSIHDAKLFFRDVTHNKHLRSSLEKASSQKQIAELLLSIPYDFNTDELDDAFRNLHANCQTEEQAILLKDIKQWWDFLLFCTPDTAS